jgi:hypothetical protein
MGFQDEEVTELTGHKEKWKGIFNRIVDTIPRHSFEPLLAAIFHSEQTVAETTLEDALKADEKAKEETSTYGNPDRARALLTRVINRWTTLPAPTEQTWRAATEQDPDLKQVLKALQDHTELS